MVNAHGLAASIRSAQESEVFDLAGQNATSIEQTIKTAFSEPFELNEMIRLTFVTGAGKLARQKYDEGAARAVTSVLIQLGYGEDRGASGTLDCAGTFKMQHDTGKNLKTVVVYPKITSTENGSMNEQDAIPSLIPINSPDYKVAMSSMNVFRNIVNNKCPTWTDKKGCLTCVENLQNMLQELESKLCKGAILDASEQDFYDNVTGLNEKEEFVKKLIQEQVFEQGQITEKEKQTLLGMVSEKIASLQKEHKSAIKLLQRKEALLEIETIPPYPLKHESEIRKIVKDKLVPIEIIEEEAKGRLLTLKETQILAQKDDLLGLVEEYELASRGWFEDEDTFQSRLQHSRQQRNSAKTRKNKSGNTKTNAPMKTTSSSSTVNKWILPGSTKTNSSKTTKKSKLKGADVFSAMLIDSSDDEEEEVIEKETPEIDGKKSLTKPNKATKSQQESQNKIKTNNQVAKNEPINANKASETSAKPTEENNSASNISIPKDGKSKKKKSKKKKKTEEIVESKIPTQVQLTPGTIIANNVAEKSENDSHIVIITLKFVYEIVRDYLFPFILAILAWIIGKLFGTKKKTKGSKK